MSIKVMARVWEDPTITDRTELLTLLALADWANDRGECDPSYTQLAKKVRVSRRYAITIVSRLAEQGTLRIKDGAGFTYAKGAVSNLVTLVKHASPSDPQITRGGEPQITTPSDPQITHNSQPLQSTTTKDLLAPAKRRTPPATIPDLRRRDPKPLFDAFMETFPGVEPKRAGRFNTDCLALGLTADQWRRFVVTPKAATDLVAGFLTPGNALNRFVAWARKSAKPAVLPDGRDPYTASLDWITRRGMS